MLLRATRELQEQNMAAAGRRPRHSRMIMLGFRDTQRRRRSRYGADAMRFKRLMLAFSRTQFKNIYHFCYAAQPASRLRFRFRQAAAAIAGLCLTARRGVCNTRVALSII